MIAGPVTRLTYHTFGREEVRSARQEKLPQLATAPHRPTWRIVAHRHRKAA